MKILVSMPHGAVRDSFFTDDIREKLADLGDVVYNESEKNYTENEMRRALGDVDVCITGWGNVKLTDDVLSGAPSLRVIAHTGGTVAPIVDDSAYDRNIKVLSGNEIFAQSVAEGTVCYILSALRRIPQYCAEMQKDGWAHKNWYNEGLIGQRVGLVGFGAVARNAAKLLRAFDTEILICADHVTEDEARRYGARKASMEEIFSTCKIVSVHLAQTPETYHIIDKSLLSMLSPDALLVNTARGSVIDEAEMARMLSEKKFSAVLDVFEVEPLPMTSPLRGLDNAILIPHMGGPTIDRRPFVTSALIDAVADVLGEKETPLEISRDAMHRMTV